MLLGNLNLLLFSPTSPGSHNASLVHTVCPLNARCLLQQPRLFRFALCLRTAPRELSPSGCCCEHSSEGDRLQSVMGTALSLRERSSSGPGDWYLVDQCLCFGGNPSYTRGLLCVDCSGPLDDPVHCSGRSCLEQL